jgi:GntR family histidine utilization transcriptional repressor
VSLPASPLIQNGPSIAASEPPSPLYQRVKDGILRRISVGEFLPGSRIPSEHEIVAAQGVSRMTANRALRELTSEGILVRVQGVGTFVAIRKPYSALVEIKSIADEIAARGGRHRAEIRTLRAETAPGSLAELLGLSAGARVFHSVIVHWENEIPVQLEDRYVNPAVAPDYLAQDFARVTPSEYLLNVTALSEIEHVIEAMPPDRALCRLLKIEMDEPCLVLRRRTWSGPHIATMARFVHPGSRYQLGSRFRPNGSTLG